MGLRGRSWAPDRSATAQVCDTPATVVCEVAGMSPLLPTSARSAKGPRECRTFQPLRNPPKGYIRPHPKMRSAVLEQSSKGGR